MAAVLTVATPWPLSNHSNLSQLKSSSMSSPWRKLGRPETLPCDENPSPAACNTATTINCKTQQPFCASNTYILWQPGQARCQGFLQHLSHSARNSTSTLSSAGLCWTHLPTQDLLVRTGPTYPLRTHLSHSARNSTSTLSSAGWCWTHLPTQDWLAYPHRTDSLTHTGLTHLPHRAHLPTRDPPSACCPQQCKYFITNWVVLDPLTYTGPTYPHSAH